MNNMAQRDLEYKKYIDNHIANVKKCYLKYGKELCDRLGVDTELLEQMVEDHDQSKYSKDEFDGYRSWFYPTLEEENQDNRNFRKSKFDVAWLHHLRNNAHHPEFWVYINDEGVPKCHPMDPIHIAEMLLDWAAMGIAKGDTAYEYWKNNMSTKPLNRTTIEIVDSCIDIFKEPYTE